MLLNLEFNIILVLIFKMSEIGRAASVECGRSQSFCIRRKSSTFLAERVRENQLQWMFNRRKTKLAKTSE